MNKEEAIAILNHKVSACLHGTEWGEALEMAIEALKQEPFDKCLVCRDYDVVNQHCMFIPDYCHDYNKYLPIKPKTGHWIPVSERLPEIDEPVLIFQRYYSGANITIGRYHSDEDQGGYRYWQWIKYDNHFSYGIDHFGIICPDSYYVDAWMPLPKSYDPQESDHKCHTCKHYTSGEHDGSCGSYICKGYSNWEREEV